jgi:predicted ATPase
MVLDANNHCCQRIVVTGGPGAGKTTAVDMFRRELGDHIVVVPESATMLYQGGFPRVNESKAQKTVQRAIYFLQKNLEDTQTDLYPGRVLLCDRGTLDGEAYWPGTSEEYFRYLGTHREAEFKRYDAVLFLESAAVGGISIEGGNRFRVESVEQAARVDKKLKEIWQGHPHFAFVPHHPSFLTKILTGLESLRSILSKLACGVGPGS